jgi:hypothetical protein
MRAQACEAYKRRKITEKPSLCSLDCGVIIINHKKCATILSRINSVLKMGARKPFAGLEQVLGELSSLFSEDLW